ncbi:MAG: Holliday junction resolvase RuvX [Alphaproteobacteria bacterium]
MIYKNNNNYLEILPKKGRILGLDLGSKNIGLAICEDTQNIATPKKILRRKNNNYDFAILLSIIQENHLVAIIFGLPLKMDGSENLMVDFVMKFMQNFDEFLQNHKINLPLIAFDERLTSFDARYLSKTNSKKNKDIDDVSAYLILNDFLEYLRQVRN